MTKSLFTSIAILLILSSCEKETDTEGNDQEVSTEEKIKILPDTTGFPADKIFFEFHEGNKIYKIQDVKQQRVWRYYYKNDNGNIQLQQKNNYKFRCLAPDISKNDSLTAEITWLYDESITSLLSLDNPSKNKWKYFSAEEKFSTFFQKAQLQITVYPDWKVHTIDYKIHSLRRVFFEGNQYCQVHFTINTKIYHPDQSGSGYRKLQGGDNFFHKSEIINGDFTITIE